MKTIKSLFALFLLAGFLTACEDNPVEDDHDEHALSDVHRLVLMMNGAEIVIIEDNALAGGDPGYIAVDAGEESPLISLEAFAEDGDEIHLDELGDEYSLQAEDLDEAIAEFEQHDGERWSFHIHGESADTTQLELNLLHDDHADFTTPLIDVIVAAPEGDDAAGQ